MKKITIVLILGLTFASVGFYSKKKAGYKVDESRLLHYEVNPAKQQLKFFWKDQEGKNYVDFQNLKIDLKSEGKELVFAMNGGMYNKDLTPQGLYVENEEVLAPLNTTKKGYGNFYLQPNGVFYLTTDNQARVVVTDQFGSDDNIKYATQSGPMLLIESKIHPKFTKGSTNLHIRNGVGVLPNGNLLFAMSKEEINFYDLASYFKQKGCENALYLDGFVSRTYLPSKNWKQLKGKFGVIISEISPNY